jgi:hypothetical protein
VRRRFICIPSARESFQPVFMVQAAQHGFLGDSGPTRQNVSAAARGEKGIAAIRNARPECRMWSGLVVMAYPVAKNMPKVALVEWDQIIQAFAPGCTKF